MGSGTIQSTTKQPVCNDYCFSSPYLQLAAPCQFLREISERSLRLVGRQFMASVIRRNACDRTTSSGREGMTQFFDWTRVGCAQRDRDRARVSNVIGFFADRVDRVVVSIDPIA